MGSELGQRIVSGLVLAVVTLLATWFGGLWFRVVAVVVSLLIFYEWSTITAKARAGDVALNAGWVTMGLMAIALLLGLESAALAIVALGTAIVLALTKPAGRSRIWLAAGVCYAGLAGISVTQIRGDVGQAGFIAILFLFAVVWATDIAAYFSGRAFGGPKLAPAVSPSKTWSGAAGGALAAAICGTALIAATSGNWGIATVLLAIVLSIASQSGDLFESWVKRRFGVKDSSQLIPGHGGVMDRVDGLIFAACAAYAISVLTLLSGVGEDGLARTLLGY